MRVINLYHHLSRAMFYDLDKRVLIDGERALELQGKVNKGECKDIGWKEHDDNITADIWGNGKPTKLYGRIYEVC